MSLIINKPTERPNKYWHKVNDGTLELRHERRPASYEIINTRDQTRRVEEIELVNIIRERVDQWREAGYPGITIVTRKLLEHWHDETARELQFYFCQLEAIETLIWWVEGAAEYKQGIHIQGDGGPWERLCNKMATGSGKTTVMAMIIAWQVLNALTYPKRNKDFSRAIFIVAPGLTVKGRLQVLIPADDSYYDEFNICPDNAMRQKLNQAEVLIENWHSLMPAKEPERSVVKKGPETDEAFTRRVLGKLAEFKDIVVINDEAHHAYRENPRDKVGKNKAKAMGLDPDEATRWVEGLDRIYKTRRISRCFDLSATPFSPSGMAASDHALFTWIISDFGLNDAIEAGLVKTPRVVVRDDAIPDAATLRPKLYHIYRDKSVSEDLNRKAEPHEPLPQLVQQAYTLLGADWRATLQDWEKQGMHSPPVLLTVCNRTETAARIEYYFNSGDAYWPEMQAPAKTLRVDSKVLEKAEVGDKATADKPYEERLHEIVKAASIPETIKSDLLEGKKEELLREIVDNVGKRNGAGQDLQNVISVAMLSEGWDAKNVTHIMGLRAFTSQLLCEQVIGRGLRRVSYDKEIGGDRDGLFVTEYVNVFGVPLSIYQDNSDDPTPPKPPKPSTQIEVVKERAEHELRWPNILRVEHVLQHHLVVDWDAVPALELDPAATVISAEIAPAMNGASDMSQIVPIDLEKVPEGFRLQRLIFLAARKAFADLAPSFVGREELLLKQLIKLVETFLASDALVIPSLFHQDPLRKRILIGLNIDTVVQHVSQYIRQENRTAVVPVFDEERPVGRTGDMRTWYTTKPTVVAHKSHISHVVGDAGWEGYAANALERSESVQSYAKNDHLGLEIFYLWNGSRRRYIPDFLVKSKQGQNLVLEIKGQKSAQNDAKHSALEEWVAAVNEDGRFGKWRWDVAYSPTDVDNILENLDDDSNVKKLEIAKLIIRLEGSIDDPRAEKWVEQYVTALRNTFLSKETNYSFRYGEAGIALSQISVELVDIVEGSILARAALFGHFLLGTYGAIAAYPSFKEALPVISSDIQHVIEQVLENAPKDGEGTPKPIQIDFHIRDEREIEDELRGVKAADDL
ncbi:MULTISPECIES: BPTD_3080 family restriction endonuclease [unclassified Ruegeria]|uniref:BPTD_3080 family restriction endonuclease n=1 Tax=unclassified Ruegeria TaxID=2625375 RepID=UPI001491EF19|nr:MULTISPECIES: DEAD/DEAH box helicase family protein [unclassified Ruegeria]NOD90124.1 DEAD/DEAH box helicase family protein [Ruegeria sp. HKCCD4318]NOE15197.1 DEAD/DEAH box helicase family protein [Ruegeria sp. HKCCD4318-2]NOG10592.1 DEAD/DEAH box helicase family protein [Ruegeria sp. HKCCD4315]